MFAPPIQQRLVFLARRCVSAWDAATKLVQGHVALQKLSTILGYGFFMFWGALADVARGLVKGKGAMVKECHELSKQKAFDGIAELLACADDLHGLKKDCDKIVAAEAAIDLYDKMRTYGVRAGSLVPRRVPHGARETQGHQLGDRHAESNHQGIKACRNLCVYIILVAVGFTTPLVQRSPGIPMRAI